MDCYWAEFAPKMLRRGAVHHSESTLLTVYQPSSATKKGKKCRLGRTGNLSKKLEASKSIWRLCLLYVFVRFCTLLVCVYIYMYIVCHSGSRRPPHDRMERNRRIKRCGYFGELCVCILKNVEMRPNIAQVGLLLAEFASKVLRRGAVHPSESTLLTVYQPRSATKKGKKCRLERTGLESKKLETSKSIWLERARADWPRALWP